MEYFANRIRELSLPRSEIPVELTAVHVGPGRNRKREMISIDISEYGDPLSSRTIRIPLTAYRKPWLNGMLADRGLENQIGHFVTLPLHEMDIRQCLKCRQDIHDIAALAKCASVTIPSQNSGTLKLINEYDRSPLRKFHESFYEDDLLSENDLLRKYDETPVEMPGCLEHVFIFPNEALLKPAMIQLVTRCLLSAEWKPRDIAGIVAAKFSNPEYNWGTAWENYCPIRRAEFYVRIFSGLISLGDDPLIDFNCTSQQEKGFCWPHSQPCSLHPCYVNLQTKSLER